MGVGVTTISLSYPFVPCRDLCTVDGVRFTWGQAEAGAGVISTGYGPHGPDECLGLLTLEPPTVLPGIWSPVHRGRYRRVWTYDPQSDQETRITYPWPFGWPELPDEPDPTPWEDRLDAVCVVTGNKTSDVPGELYSQRAEVIRRLESEGRDVHVYGNPPWTTPGRYCGSIPLKEKVRTMARYRYAVALENTDQPSYFTEKLPDVLAAGCKCLLYLGHEPEGVPGLDPVDLPAIRRHMSVERLCSTILHSI
jgi:hypothetical protein